MTPKQFEKYLQRDFYRCPHCGDDTTLIPQHRKNRGMGGSKLRDVPSNILVLCSWANNFAETSPTFASECREKGWKLESWQNPLTEPFLDECDGFWYLLDDKFGRTRVA